MLTTTEIALPLAFIRTQPGFSWVQSAYNHYTLLGNTATMKDVYIATYSLMLEWVCRPNPLTTAETKLLIVCRCFDIIFKRSCLAVSKVI